MEFASKIGAANSNRQGIDTVRFVDCDSGFGAGVPGEHRATGRDGEKSVGSVQPFSHPGTGTIASRSSGAFDAVDAADAEQPTATRSDSAPSNEKIRADFTGDRRLHLLWPREQQVDQSVE